MVDQAAAQQRARQLAAQYGISLDQALTFVQRYGLMAVPANAPGVQGNTQKPSVTGNPPAGSQAANPAPAQGAAQRPVAPSNPGVSRDSGRSFAGVEGDPGPEEYAQDDKFGPGMKRNTNQAGVQSNGDDDPWKIGAFEGGTYDPQVMNKWVQRAQAGDGSARWVLEQVGYKPGMSGEEWAASRGLSAYDQAFAPGGAWYRDQQGARSQAPAPGTRDVARDQAPSEPPADDWDPQRREINRQTVEYADDPWQQLASSFKDRPPLTMGPDGSAGHGGSAPGYRVVPYEPGVTRTVPDSNGGEFAPTGDGAYYDNTQATSFSAPQTPKLQRAQDDEIAPKFERWFR